MSFLFGINVRQSVPSFGVREVLYYYLYYYAVYGLYNYACSESNKDMSCSTMWAMAYVSALHNLKC